MSAVRPRRGRLGAALAVTAAALVLSACSSGSAGPTSSAAGTSGGSTKPVRVAVLIGATTNAYQGASLAAAKEAAAKLGDVQLTTYDANFDAAKQVSQLEDVLSLGRSRFDAVLIFPSDNNLPVDAARRALAAGFKIGVSDGVLGPRLDTKDLQVDGISVQIGPVWSEYGKRLGKLTVQACEGVDPCNVVFTKGLTNWAPETEFRSTFKALVGTQPNIHIVAEPGDTGYSRDGGAKVIGDAVQANKNVNVIVAADQALLGAEGVLQDAGLYGKVKLVGLGGTQQSVPRIESDKWFGTVGQAPADEGRIALEALVAAVRQGKTTGGIDSQASLVNDAVITKQYAKQFSAQFPG